MSQVEDGTPSLRQIIQVLRDIYNQRIFNISARLPLERSHIPSLNSDDNLLQLVWQRHVQIAELQICSQGALAHSEDLFAGLVQWLGHLIHNEEVLQEIRPCTAKVISISPHLIYGQLVKSEWQHLNDERELGIGFLLGTRNGMPMDMSTKLNMMASSNRQVQNLLILWPRDPEFAGEAFEHLPRATRRIWDNYQSNAKSKQVRLTAVAPKELALLLPLRGWEQELYETDISETHIHSFIFNQTQFLQNLMWSTPHAF